MGTSIPRNLTTQPIHSLQPQYNLASGVSTVLEERCGQLHNITKTGTRSYKITNRIHDLTPQPQCAAPTRLQKLQLFRYKDYARGRFLSSHCLPTLRFVPMNLKHLKNTITIAYSSHMKTVPNLLKHLLRNRNGSTKPPSWSSCSSTLEHQMISSKDRHTNLSKRGLPTLLPSFLEFFGSLPASSFQAPFQKAEMPQQQEFSREHHTFATTCKTTMVASVETSVHNVNPIAPATSLLQNAHRNPILFIPVVDTGLINCTPLKYNVGIWCSHSQHPSPSPSEAESLIATDSEGCVPMPVTVP